MSGPRIITLDIETAPALADVWGLWDQNVSLSQLRRVSDVLAVGWKTHGVNVVDYATRWADGDDMLKTVHSVLNQTDILVTFNGKRFDVPHLNRKFLLAGLGPTRPYKHVDLFPVIKQVFRFQSNKLDHVAEQILGQRKMKHEGHEMWTKVLLGDPVAQANMVRYMKTDVRLTERVYDAIRGFIPNHPHMGLYEGTEALVCTNCGSTDLSKQGTRANVNFQAYQQYKCKRCGKWLRGTKIIGRVGAIRGDK